MRIVGLLGFAACLALSFPVQQTPLAVSPRALNRIFFGDNLTDSNAPATTTISDDDRDLLAMFAAYSGAAYTVSSEWNCSYACEYPGTEGTVVEYFWNVGTPESAGYIARNPKQKLIVVSFRGTENLPQWIENLDFSLVQWPEGVNSSHVHNGFVRSYLKVQDIVLTKVEELAFKYPDYWISLVGHSLGGAKAALCLLDLSIKLPELLPRLLLCTQGQPRVGNRGFASAIDALDIPKYREVYEFDIVPRIPLVVMGYHHYNHEVWDHVNTASICLEPTVLDGCAALGNFAYPLNIGDHTKYRGLRYW